MIIKITILLYANNNNNNIGLQHLKVPFPELVQSAVDYYGAVRKPSQSFCFNLTSLAKHIAYLHLKYLRD